MMIQKQTDENFGEALLRAFDAIDSLEARRRFVDRLSVEDTEKLAYALGRRSLEKAVPR